MLLVRHNTIGRIWSYIMLLEARTRRADALMRRYGIVQCARRPRTGRHPHRACSRIDAIAQGCERPKRCGASFALQASRVVLWLQPERDASARERFRCYCGSGADGVLCWACSKADLTKRGAGINNGDFHFAAKKLQRVSVPQLRDL